MSVSSHLSPEPERRLWIIHENVRGAAQWTDIKLGALTAFAAAELALVVFAVPDLSHLDLALALLAAIVPIGLVSLSPLIESRRRLPLADPVINMMYSGDCLIAARDIARYTHLELVSRLDKYLGGGITATRYYEDIVDQIIIHSRIAVRKRRVLLSACCMALAAQFWLFWQFARR